MSNKKLENLWRNPVPHEFEGILETQNVVLVEVLQLGYV